MKNKSKFFLTLICGGLLSTQTTQTERRDYYVKQDRYIDRDGSEHYTHTGAVASNVVDDIFGNKDHNRGVRKERTRYHYVD